jgi:hypothetical protein
MTTRSSPAVEIMSKDSLVEFFGFTIVYLIKAGNAARRIYLGVGESARRQSEWSYRSSGQSKDGPMSIKHKDVKLGPDEDRHAIQEFILDGKSSPFRCRCGSGRSRSMAHIRLKMLSVPSPTKCWRITSAMRSDLRFASN